MDRPIKLPGPDHPIGIAQQSGRVVVRLAGQVIAETRSALLLREAGHDEAHYIPRADVNMALLERTAHQTHCPYKGDASYFSIPAGGERSVNAVWSYEAPFPAVSSIRDYLAFYPERVDTITVNAAL